MFAFAFAFAFVCDLVEKSTDGIREKGGGWLIIIIKRKKEANLIESDIEKTEGKKETQKQKVLFFPSLFCD